MSNMNRGYTGDTNFLLAINRGNLELHAFPSVYIEQIQCDVRGAVMPRKNSHRKHI